MASTSSQKIEKLYLELFGPEYLELDSEYLRVTQDIPVNRIQTTDTPNNDIEQRKAKAKYEREAAAKCTRYSLESTIQLHPSIRLCPIQEDVTPAIYNGTDKLTVEYRKLKDQKDVTKMSNKQLKRKLYQDKCRLIRRHQKLKKENN